MSESSVLPTHPGFKDLTGQIFNRLSVVSYAEKKGSTHYWTCRCRCGTVKAIQAGSIMSGAVKSCGCLNREVTAKRSKVHGLHKHPDYGVWNSVIQRCTNKKAANFHTYGGRGIEICERWRQCEQFFKDMGPRPSKKHSIERIDVNGNYCPENCRWADPKEQARNRRNNRLLNFQGETRCASEWAEYAGLPYHAVLNRLSLGWSVKDALTVPARCAQTVLTYDGRTQSISEWAKETGIPLGTIRSRIARGWSDEKALTARVSKNPLLEFQGKTRSVTEWAGQLGVSSQLIRGRLKKGWSVEKALSTPVRIYKKSTDV